MLLGLAAPCFLVVSGVSSVVYGRVVGLCYQNYWVRIGNGRRNCGEQCNNGDAVVELHVEDEIDGFCSELVVSVVTYRMYCLTGSYTIQGSIRKIPICSLCNTATLQSSKQARS